MGVYGFWALHITDMQISMDNDICLIFCSLAERTFGSDLFMSSIFSLVYAFSYRQMEQGCRPAWVPQALTMRESGSAGVRECGSPTGQVESWIAHAPLFNNECVLQGHRCMACILRIGPLDRQRPSHHATKCDAETILPGGGVADLTVILNISKISLVPLNYPCIMQYRRKPKAIVKLACKNAEAKPFICAFVQI